MFRLGVYFLLEHGKQHIHGVPVDFRGPMTKSGEAFLSCLGVTADRLRFGMGGAAPCLLLLGRGRPYLRFGTSSAFDGFAPWARWFGLWVVALVLRENPTSQERKTLPRSLIGLKGAEGGHVLPQLGWRHDNEGWIRWSGLA